MLYDKRAEQLGRLDERVKSIEGRVRDLETESVERRLDRSRWSRVLVAGLLAILASLISAIVALSTTYLL
jgi:hypothetical protein